MARCSSEPRCSWAEPGGTGGRITGITSSSRGGRRGMLFRLGCTGAYQCTSGRIPLSRMLSGQVHQVFLGKTLREGKIVQAVAKAAEWRVSRLSGDLPSCPHTSGHLLCLCCRVFNFWAGRGSEGRQGVQTARAGSHQRNRNNRIWQVLLGETSLARGTSTPTNTFKTTPSVHWLIF